MALVGSYSVSGSSASITTSYEYSTLDELLVQLPNNSGHLIDPGDIRDSVYTLWQRIGSVSVIAASAASASALFQNSNPSTVPVGGFTAGTTFPTPVNMQSMWNQLLYPYVAPSASLSIAGTSSREYGHPAGLSFNLVWSVTQNTLTNNIVTITVDGVPQTFPPLSNTKPAVGTHSWNNSNVSETQTFSMTTVDDYVSTVVTSTTLTWMNKIYWGKIDLSSINNPNLTFNPGSASLVTALCTDTIIANLSGAGISPGSELSTTKSRTYTNINAAGDYLIFAWPSCVSGALTPQFIVNGTPNTAFTRVRTASQYENDWGFKTNYEVWVSNTAQNSQLTIIVN